MVDLRRRSDELLDEEYLYRIGKAKDDGLIAETWEELTPVLNEECGEEKGPCTWRKHYASGKKWQAVFAKQGCIEDVAALRERQQGIAKERIKLRDERTALNKELREQARYEVNNELWERKLAELGQTKFPVVAVPQLDGDCSLLICLSDWHIGMTFNSCTGQYDTDIAWNRLSQLLCQIRDIQQRHNVASAHIVLLGDLISGAPHPVVAMQNREDVVDQVILAGEMLAQFIYNISMLFTNVYVTAVNGNHSRLTPNKKDAIIGERLDRLVTWHATTECKHLPNVSISQPLDGFHGTLEIIEIRGKSYVLDHGDFDQFTEAGVSKLISYLGFVPNAIISAHKHTPAYMEVNSVACVQNGCLSGGGDQFTLEHRLGGKPSQTVCVCSDAGIEVMYPIKLI